MVRTALVVITYNGEKDIKRFLESLQNTNHRDYQSLIIVDNDSHDDTLVVSQHLASHAHIIRNQENKGYAVAANQGMQYAADHDFDYVFLANQDLMFEKDFLPPLVHAMESDPSVGAIQPLIMLDPERDLINSCGNALHPAGFGYTLGYRVTPAQFSCERKNVAYCSGAAVLFRVSAIKRIGQFDEDFFMYHEDTDICWRMQLAGYHCMVEPSSLVYHHYEFSRSIKKFYYMERNRLLILLKNYSISSIILFAPLVLFWEAGMLAYSAMMTVVGKGTLTIKEKLRTYRYFFSTQHWRQLLAKRTAIQKMRIVPDRTIIALFESSIRFQDVDNPFLRVIANPITRCYFFFAKQILRLF